MKISYSEGVNRIAAERQRQIEKEGWSAEHDNDHQIGELADAALTYTAVASCQASRSIAYTLKFIASIRSEREGIPWPWGWNWFKPSDDPIRNLEKAGALIAAEIDRILRARGHSNER